jgi:hypothetical protein
MPNWVQTLASITGDEQEINKFLTASTVKDENGNEMLNIIPSLVPCPKELKILSGSMSQDTPEYETWLKQKEENLAKFGYTDWYEWEYDTWGTKWGDCDTNIIDRAEGNLLLQFATAWGPADKAWLTISKLFPTLSFQFDYDEEAGFFCGYHVIRDGSIIFETMFIPCDNPFDWEEQEEEHEKWKEAEQDKIDALLLKFWAEEMKK